MTHSTTKLMLLVVLHWCGVNLFAQDTDTEVRKPEWGAELTSELQATHDGDYNYVNLLKLNASLPIGKRLTFEATSLSTCMTSDFCIGQDLQVFSNIDAGNIPFTLSVFGFGWDINDNHSLFLGIRNINGDYFTSDVTSFFTNSTCGIYPTLSANYPIANYPLASVGMHYRYETVIGADAGANAPDIFALQTSVYNGMGYYKFSGRENLFRFCPKSDGIFALAQVEYQHAGSSYFLGACGRGVFDDEALYEPSDSRLRATLWAYAEQRINDNLSLIAGYSHAFGKDRLCSNFVGVGGKYSWKRCELGLFTDYAHFAIGGESATELTFKYQVSLHVYLQPTAHFIVTPSDTEGAGHVVRTAGTIRFGLSF